MTEYWKEIIEYEGMYQVSNLGNVRSMGRYANESSYQDSRWLKPKKIIPQKTGEGYLSVTLRKGGRKEIISVHWPQ